MSNNPSSRNSSLSHGVNKTKEQLVEHPPGPQKGTTPVPIASEKKQSRQMTPTREANTEFGRRGPPGGLPPRMGEISSFPQCNVPSRSSSNRGTQSWSGKSSDERGGRSSPKVPNGPPAPKVNGLTSDTRGDATPRHGQKNSSKASGLVIGNNDLQRPTMLAWQLTQTVYGDSNLWCYKFKFPESSKNGAVAEPHLPTFVEYLLKTKLVGTKGCIFTDYQKYVVSTTQLGEHVETKDSILSLIGKFPWSTMLKFLDSGKFPEDSLRKALTGLLSVLVCQMNKSQKSNHAEQKPFKVLDVRHTTPFQRESLAIVIQKFLAEDPKNLRRLETYLKGRQVQVSYQKRADGVQVSKDSVEKSIVGLARVDDARGSKVPWPPKVSKYGASSGQVNFFIKPNRKSKTATASTSNATITNRYATVAEYFEKNKGQPLSHPDLPVINVGTRRKPVYLPPELCELKDSCTISEMDHNDLEAFARAVDIQYLLGNRNVTRESLAPGLKLPPGFRASDCCIDITVASTLTPCRLLGSPEITYGRDKFTIDTTCGSWETNTFDFAKHQAGQRRRLAMLRFSPSRTAEVMKKEEETLKNTLKSGNLRDKLRKYSILLDENTPIETIAMPSGKPNKAARESIREKLRALAKPRSGPEPDAVLVILPKKEQSVYDCVKHQCDVVLGIQSLCVVMFQFTSERDGYYSQVGLKFNLKSMGQSQVLAQPGFRFFTLETTMVVGFDTMVPPTGTGEHAKGIATTVASKDKDLSQWPASVEVLAKEPVHKVFTELLRRRIEYWKVNNGKYPSNVIIYRNGPSARNRQAFSEEISMIETYLSRVPNKEPPTLTFIAVSKDHNAQFRTPESLSHSPEAQEIPAKPVLIRTGEGERDKTWEFVIQGHKPMKKKKYDEAISQHSGLQANQATLPVRYSVLKDGLFTKQEARKELEDLTHQMCYLSGHGTSYVTETLPIHYVGLLCKRIHSYVRPWYYPRNGDALQRPLLQTTVQPHKAIADTMYYI